METKYEKFSRIIPIILFISFLALYSVFPETSFHIEQLILKSYMVYISDTVRFSGNVAFANRLYSAFELLLVAGYFYSIWLLGIIPAVVLTIIGWCLLFFIHLQLFKFGHLYLPMADSAIFSFFVTGVALFWRLKIEGDIINRKRREVLSKRKQVIDKTVLLDSFSNSLFQLNKNINDLLVEYESTIRDLGKSKLVFLKLLGATEDLQDFIVGIKQFSYLTEGEEQEVACSWFNVRAMIDRVVKQFDSKCIDRRLVVDVNCDATLQIYSVEPVVENILHNFVSNAVKYTSIDSHIQINVTSDRKRKKVVISVADQGNGIPKKHHKDIFKKFYRVHNAEMRDIKGNGLGLFLCWFFAKKIEASLRLSSKVGEGSTFYIRLSCSVKM